MESLERILHFLDLESTYEISYLKEYDVCGQMKSSLPCSIFENVDWYKLRHLSINDATISNLLSVKIIDDDDCCSIIFKGLRNMKKTNFSDEIIFYDKFYLKNYDLDKTNIVKLNVKKHDNGTKLSFDFRRASSIEQLQIVLHYLIKILQYCSNKKKNTDYLLLDYYNEDKVLPMPFPNSKIKFIFNDRNDYTKAFVVPKLVYTSLSLSTYCDMDTIGNKKNKHERNTFNEMSVLKYFNYSRYVDRKRTPCFSFTKPTGQNIYYLRKWPSHFLSSPVFYVNSPKFSSPIEIKQCYGLTSDILYRMEVKEEHHHQQAYLEYNMFYINLARILVSYNRLPRVNQQSLYEFVTRVETVDMAYFGQMNMHHINIYNFVQDLFQDHFDEKEIYKILFQSEFWVEQYNIKSPCGKYRWLQHKDILENNSMLVERSNTVASYNKYHTVEFPSIYFWSNREDRYVSVTNSSPAFLPSLTKKRKNNITTVGSQSSYFDKIDKQLKRFLVDIYCASIACIKLRKEASENVNFDSLKSLNNFDIKKNYISLCDETKSNVILFRCFGNGSAANSCKNKEPMIVPIFKYIKPEETLYRYDQFTIFSLKCNDRSINQIYLQEKKRKPKSFYRERPIHTLVKIFF